MPPAMISPGAGRGAAVVETVAEIEMRTVQGRRRGSGWSSPRRGGSLSALGDHQRGVLPEVVVVADRADQPVLARLEADAAVLGDGLAGVRRGRPAELDGRVG